MRVAWFPKTSDLAGNPYWELLQRHLELEGVEFVDNHESYWMTRRWLLRERLNVDVLHFHFIQPQYLESTTIRMLRRLMKFTSDLLLARALGYRVVWTLHDQMPPWPAQPKWVDLLGRRIMAQLSHAVIVHCNEARRLLSERFHRSQEVWLTPHPAFPVVHFSREESRDVLGLNANGFILLFFGGIRPNKGVEQLIAAFHSVASPDDKLLIAGRPWPPKEYVESIYRLSESDSRILLDTNSISDEKLQMYIRAANVVVFPFREILTSSSVTLAMSCSRPVIVPHLGCPPEIIGDDAGFVYDPKDASALAAAIHQASKSDLDTMGECAAKRINSYTWSDMARATIEVYNHGAHKDQTALH